MSINSEKREILKYIGDFSQLFGVRECVLKGGRADGVRAIDVKNGSGLEFTVLPDRCMDIANLSFKGVNFSYLSKTGISSPAYYEPEGDEFLRNFYAGFMTTCGLRNIGAACVDDGERLTLHGRISSIPAEQVSATTQWISNEAVMRVSGSMRESKVFGENLILSREIIVKYSENIIYINDTIENLGFRDEPFMLLYHCNLGYPLLSSKSYFVAPSKKILFQKMMKLRMG